MTRLQSWFGRLARIEKIFLVLLVLWGIERVAFAGSTLELLSLIAVYFSGAAVAYRWARVGMKKFLWRLRNRLVVAYLLIAVVPILLLLALALTGAWILTGQIAVYMVTTELERRTNSLLDPARGIAAAPRELRTGRAQWIAPYFRERFPGFEMVIRDGSEERRFPENAALASPPGGWGDVSGLLAKNGTLYLWAHAVQGSTEVTMMAPVSRDTLPGVIPNIGDLIIVPRDLLRDLRARGLSARKSGIDLLQRDRVPPPVNRFDREVSYVAPIPVAVWEKPDTMRSDALIVDTRISAVLRTIFGQRVELEEGYTMARLFSYAMAIVAGVFLVFEIASLVAGIRFTRHITGAVHNLYEGTQRVREGNFSHRIEIRGNDQIAEVGASFNRMTENLERLVEVAKEKERLQSELEIAREVQNQLYPKTTPASKTLELMALCRPARMVSGDYYDYLNLDDPKVALAIGDVAGKGISAALLMATVQSTMRTQLRTGREMAAAAGNGRSQQMMSTAALVSRLNQQLYAFTPPEKFATFYFAVYDDSTGLMTYTNAGHLPPALIRGGSVTRLDVTGTVVGAFPFSRYEESSIQLERGDLLVCFTDGITEPENEYGEMFGEDRLIELIMRNSSRSTGEIIESVMDSVREWTNSPELQDDMTMLVARRS